MPDESNIVTSKKLEQKLFDYVRLRLGDSMVEVELENSDYDNNLTRAVEVFRTRSSFAVEESFAFLAIQKQYLI